MSDIKLPQFNAIQLDHFVSTLDSLLKNNLQKIEQLLKQKTYTWDNLMEPLDDMDDALEKLWSPIGHLHGVINSPELRKCYQDCLPLLSAYEAAVGQNEALYKAIRSIDLKPLNSVQQKLIHDSLQSLELSGVALSADKKQRFEAISTELSELNNQFDNNVLDATQAFTVEINDEARLSGLPEHAIQTAKALAVEKGINGWLLNLEFPCYLAVITYADDRALREQFYKAYVTRASRHATNGEQYDNSPIINKILALRHEKAQLLGFTNYAELSIATKMVRSTTEVTDFLMDLSSRAYQQAKNEFLQLQDFAYHAKNHKQLEPWDMAYLSEKMRKQFFDLSQEELRPYFPLEKVMTGLFTIIHRLYGISLEEVDSADVWHPEVTCYRLIDEEGQERGYVYADLFARQNKRGGAWMDGLQSRRLSHGHLQLPIAVLVCNFAKPIAGKEALLSHEEVVTLFHEFGHCLHHLLTKVNYLGASGINGVEWDAVELPSQFFENFAWEHAALQQLTCHIETGEVLPDSWYNKIMAAKNFQSAMGTMRQLEFSLFDFRMHLEYNDKDDDFVQNILSEVRQLTAILPPKPYNRFQNSFSHIFAGGYAAGYYSYKWAEVLSSDAFSRFEEEGIFNQKTGHDFLHAILETGSSKKASEAFIDFRGRPATVDALLRHSGIQTQEQKVF